MPELTETPMSSAPFSMGNESPETAQDIIKKYHQLSNERQNYLYAADYIDRVTLGDSMVMGTNKSPYSGSPSSDGNAFRNVVDKPVHDVGGRCVRGLASRQEHYLFPPNASFFRLAIPSLTAMVLGADNNDPNVIAAYNVIAEDVINYMDTYEFFPIVHGLLQRVGIEGQGMIHFEEDGIRTIPLRSFTNKRDNGKLRYATINEELEKKKGGWYTHIDYDSDEVCQVKEDSTQKKKISQSACQYVVVNPKVNPYTNFSYAYAYNHFGMLNMVNNIMRSIDQGATLAGVMTMVLDPESGINKQQLQQMLNEGVFAGKVSETGRPAFLGFFSAETKINEMEWLMNLVAVMVQRLEQSFALQLFPGLESLPQMTATQVALMNEQLENEINALCSGLIQTLLIPSIKAILWVLGHDRIRLQQRPDGTWGVDKVRNSLKGEPIVQVQPIVGVSDLTKQIQLDQLWSYVKEGYALNPLAVAQRIDIVDFIAYSAAINKLPGAQYIIKPAPPQPQPGQPQQGQPQISGQSQGAPVGVNQQAPRSRS